MSSIAAPRTTDAARYRWLTDAFRTLLSAAILTLLLVTLTPFQPVALGTGEGGNIVNQLGYGLVALVAIAATLMFVEPRVALSALRPIWLVAVAWLFFAALHSPDTEAASRALLFTLAAMIAALGALLLPPTADAFRLALACAALATLMLCYAGLAVIPGTAIHQAVGSEAHHAGLWRGAFSHKNVAGAVMAALFFTGIYFLRSRWLWTGAAVTAGSLLFVLQTGSKTAALLVPLVAILVMGVRALAGRTVVAIALAVTLAVMGLLTIGSVVFAPVDALLQAVAPGTTFTGRTDLWRFAIDSWRGHHWTGFGFEYFWRSGYVVALEPSRELAWDPRGASNGHNGYLDMAIAAGVPGLALSVLVLLLAPLRDYVRVGRDRESARLADLFLMILAFGLLNSFLESFLFERASPIWMTLWLAVAGLGLLARNRLALDGGPSAGRLA